MRNCKLEAADSDFMPKRRFPIEMIAFCAFLACAVIFLFRFAKRHASVEKEQIFVFSEIFTSSVQIRVPSGKSFAFVLGVPPWVKTNSWDFSGDILVTRETQTVWQAILGPSNVTLGAWSKQHNLRWMTIRGKTTENLPFIPMHEYNILISATNLVGCSLWLERFTEIGDQSQLRIHHNTLTNK